MKKHLQLLEVKSHDMHNHVCKWKKALYEFRRHPWDNIYMMSLMKIWNFATRLLKDDKLTDGYEKNAFKDRGSWDPMILDGFIEY